jgi:4-amino-4-deoxy-L-arabinose transferase-like glycosyltransferase
MPKVNLIVILVTYARYLYSINCPTVICLFSMCYLSYGETPLVNCGPRSNFLYIAITCLLLLALFTILAYYYCFPLDTLIPLFIANRWDWQPHRKLGAKYLVVLCAGSTLLLVQSKALDKAPYKLSGAVAKLASIIFSSLAFSYWID